MGRIHVLRDNVINQIAAGEVIDRPVSVVRELVDNAVDAGATEISIEILDGGRSLIRVTDNGSGMNKEDAVLAFERHATSKLNTLSDLENLHTFGFRGEAIASICSVSRMSLRTSEGELGTLIEVTGGKITSIQSVARTRGTDIEVRNLFFNVPVRKKFLKSPDIEGAKIKDWLSKYSLTNPQVKFSLVADGQIVRSFIPESFLARAREIYGQNNEEIQYSLDDILVTGLIGHPGTAVRGGDSLSIYVNNRLVSDKLIFRAVKDGFQSMLKLVETPVGCVSISLPGQFVDINVHPQKSEVRFSAPTKVFSAVKTAVWDAVGRLRSPITAEAAGATTVSWEEREIKPSDSVNIDSISGTQATFFSSITGSGTDTSGIASTSQSFPYSQLRYIGQLLECYLLCEYNEKFVVVDMHAAHERINYNRIRKALRENSKQSQALLIPEKIELTYEQQMHFNAVQEEFSHIGLVWKQTSDRFIEVDAVPACMVGIPVYDLISEIAYSEGNLRALDAKVDSIAARLACHASIRSGRSLNREEVYALFSLMEDAELSSACPHGRPCVVSFDEASIESWFGRDK